MSTGCKIQPNSYPHFTTFTMVDWVDIFSRQAYRDILIQSLDYCRKQKGLEIWGYVIMTNHMYAILSARDGNLSNLIRDFKRYTATQVLKAIQSIPESRGDWMLKRFEFASRSNVRNGSHQLWLHDNHPEIIYSQSFFIQKLTYIHLNPVRAGWVEKAEEWLYSSLRNYLGRPAVLEINIMDFSIELGAKRSFADART